MLFVSVGLLPKVNTSTSVRLQAPEAAHILFTESVFLVHTTTAGSTVNFLHLVSN